MLRFTLEAYNFWVKQSRLLAICTVGIVLSSDVARGQTTPAIEKPAVTIQLRLTPSSPEAVLESTPEKAAVPITPQAPLQETVPGVVLRMHTSDPLQDRDDAQPLTGESSDALEFDSIALRRQSILEVEQLAAGPPRRDAKPGVPRLAAITGFTTPSDAVPIDQKTATLGELVLLSSSDPLSLAPSGESLRAVPSDTVAFGKDQPAGEQHDKTAGNSDAAGECPGSPDSESKVQEPQPDDVPLEQVEHPYDAPAARASNAIASKPRELPGKQLVQVLSLADEELRLEINRCLAYYIDHPETTVRRGPWALMHAVLPFGVEAEVIAGNRRVNAIGWMCYNGVCAKQRVFQPTRSGFRTNLGPGVQGHEGQFLAILAQSGVQSDYPIVIGRQSYTIMDLVKYEMATCREKSELTFKLIGLSHYLPATQQWRDNRGRGWDLEKMVAEELAQPVIGAACGGSHRLMGLSVALVKRQQAGFPLDGHWMRAEKFITDYLSYAMTLQNPDGSFSTEWFEGRGASADIDRKVQTSGHIVEWLIYTLPEDQLRTPRVESAVRFLLDSVGREPGRDWPIGPRGHALRALALYNQRVFGAEFGNMRSSIAEASSRGVQR